MTRPDTVADGLLERIVRESGVPELVEVLAERLSPTDLQSLLLEVFRRRAAQQTPAGLLERYARNRFVRPSAVSPQAMAALDRLAFSLASPPFEPIELSPVCPLGTSSAVAAVSQHLAVATIRNTEVVSDSTNVLALECAGRRREQRRTDPRTVERVRLCASQRLLRAQDYGQRSTRPDVVAHFRAFVLCTAGRDEGAHRFELQVLAEHLRFYLRLMSGAAALGFPMTGLRVAFTDLPGGIPPARVQQDLLAPLAAEFPTAELGHDPQRTSGRGYYTGLCFHIYARDAGGRERELVDGGFTTWTQILLSDRRERCLISAIGSERVCGVFGQRTSLAATL